MEFAKYSEVPNNIGEELLAKAAEGQGRRSQVESLRVGEVTHFATPPGAPRLTIGRAGADLVLEQPLVSREHAELLWQGDRHVLRDLGSEHGTFVNGERDRASERSVRATSCRSAPFRLTYDGDSLDSFDQRGAIRIDATALKRVESRAACCSTTRRCRSSRASSSRSSAAAAPASRR